MPTVPISLFSTEKQYAPVAPFYIGILLLDQYLQETSFLIETQKNSSAMKAGWMVFLCNILEIALLNGMLHKITFYQTGQRKMDLLAVVLDSFAFYTHRRRKKNLPR